MAKLRLLALLLAALSIAGCQAYKPLISPNVPELIIDEGETLEITCTSINEINVFYPEDVADITTSPHEIIAEDQSSGSKKLKFIRNQTVFGDTGWYGCSNTKEETATKDYNDPNASWIYVYVKSNESAFVQTDEVHSIFGSIGDTIQLPCRPTSPEYHVDLLYNYNILQVGETLSFDPKEGFTMKNLSAKDSGLFTCQVQQNEISSRILFIVKLVQKNTLKTPVILKEGLQHVTTGSSLHVKCRVTIGIDNNFSFTWTTPRNSSSRKILPPVREIVQANTLLVTSELVEDNVTYGDEGEYTCQVRSLNGVKKTSVYIRVYDSNFKYINLTSHDKDRHYVVNAFKPVTFSAYVDGYPAPTLAWLNPSGKEIFNSSKMIIENTESTSTLKFRSVQINDMGTYVLQAVNDAKLEYLNFTLEVLAKPYAILDENMKLYYGLNEKAVFSCNVLGNPVANVTWSYIKCPGLPVIEDCESFELRSTSIQEHEHSVDATVETTIETSGKIICTACNEFGCDSGSQEILVSDGVTDAPSGIIEPEEKITIGDDITIICAASIYNFSSVEWLDENDQPIQNSDRIKIVYNTTNFTHRSSLIIKDVKKSDEKQYCCQAKTPDNLYDRSHYKLIAEDPQAPEFTYVNMNGSEVILSAKEAHNTIHLNCHARGMPKPTIMWYKNDKLLETNEQQFILIADKRELIIRYLMEKDSGTYTCVVKNRYGEIKQFQKFVVKGTEISMIWIVTIVVLIIILVALLIYFCIKVRREKMMRKQLIEAGLMHFEEGALDCINPELTVDDQAELLPYDRKWEFPRDKLKLGKQLGSGAFGVVMKAEARGIMADESVSTVAVKMVRRNAEPAYIRALASELKIMVHLGKHLNVVNLLGACTNNIAKRELLVIVEYCRYGNLHNYLLRHRHKFINQIDPETGKIDTSIGQEFLSRSPSIDSNSRVKYAALSFSRSLSGASTVSGGPDKMNREAILYCADTDDVSGLPELVVTTNGSQPGWRSNYRGDYKDRNLKPICTQDLLSWAFQVARGMEYLCQRKVLHGDLAARNILLAENNVVKICDFGLAKTMYKDDNYQKKGDGPVPIKWMAIESIRDRVFSTQSDVWSFGVVLWEFFSLAQTPYPGMQAEIQYQRLIEGYRMEQPHYATKEIYDIMLQCWKAKPTVRPTFTELVEDIGELLEEGVKTHYVELNTPYIDMNTVGLEGKDDYLKMMSSPDHAALVSPEHEYINGSPTQPTDSAYLSMNSPLDESGIFSPRPGSTQDNPRFQFPSPSAPRTPNGTHSDGEDAPMLKKTTKEEPEEDEDNYLKPIDVHKKREDFVRQREAERRRERERSGRVSTDRDSGYCNTPKGLELTEVQVEDTRNRHPNSRARGTDDIDKSPVIIRTQDNYVNMPQQKTDLRKDVPDSFMNPSYIFVESKNSDSEML